MFTLNKSSWSHFGLIAIFLMGYDVFAGEPGNWNGWHAGVFGSYVSGKLNSDDPTHAESTKDYKDDMPMIGIGGGYNHQFDNGWVAGGEVLIPLYMKKGTATDREYYPDSVKYEASYRFGALLVVKGGRNLGNALPYAFGALGFISVDGKTLNVDENDLYSEGAVQSAAATHFVWQLGAGMDYQVSEVVFLGIRIGAFVAARADHTMPWNEPGPNNFGYKSLLVQVNGGYRF
jgi:opacity protein-like surface antigen